MANETGAERFYDKNYDQFLVLGSEVVPTVVGQEGARNRVFRFAEAYKDSCTRELEARIAELEAEVRELKGQVAELNKFLYNIAEGQKEGAR